MKYLVTTLALFATVTASAQITLENTYQTNALNFTSWGLDGYTAFNPANGNWKIYNGSHQVIKDINIPMVNGLNANQQPSYYGTGLFTSSGDFEYVTTYTNGTDSWLRVFKENGQVVLSKDYSGSSFIVPFLGEVNGQPKMIVRTLTTSEVYSLSGEWPLDVIEESGSSEYISMFPNPSTDMVTIQTPTQGTVKLVSMLGQEVRSIPVTSAGSVTFPVADLPSGTYIVRVNGVFSERLIVR